MRPGSPSIVDLRPFTWLVPALLLLLGGTQEALASSPRYVPLPFGFGANAITPDGRTLGGGGRLGEFSVAARWSEADGVQFLPIPNPADINSNSGIIGLSDDGRFASGRISADRKFTAYRQEVGGGYQLLPSLAGYSSTLSCGISADGSIVGGIAYFDRPMSGTPRQQLVRWTSSGDIQPLGWPSGSEFHDHFVWRMSKDGKTILAKDLTFSNAYVWREGEGHSYLRAPSELSLVFDIDARVVNRDGTRVFGTVNAGLSLSDYLVSWDRSGVPTLLTTATVPTGFLTTHATGNGSVVVGSTNTGTSRSPSIVWTPSGGFVPLADYVTSLGVILPTDLVRESYTLSAISDDGNALSGFAFDATGAVHTWYITVPTASGTLVLGLAAVVSRRRRG